MHDLKYHFMCPKALDAACKVHLPQEEKNTLYRNKIIIGRSVV